MTSRRIEHGPIQAPDMWPAVNEEMPAGMRRPCGRFRFLGLIAVPANAVPIYNCAHELSHHVRCSRDCPPYRGGLFDLLCYGSAGVVARCGPHDSLDQESVRTLARRFAGYW